MDTQGSAAQRVNLDLTPNPSGEWLINCEDFYYQWTSAAIPYSQLSVTVSTPSATDVQFEVFVDLYGEPCSSALPPAPPCCLDTTCARV